MRPFRYPVRLVCLLVLFGISLPAIPRAWSSFEYRLENGEFRYGITNGTDTIRLNQKKRKKAAKAAGKMNDNEGEGQVMAGPEGEGDLVTPPLPK